MPKEKININVPDELKAVFEAARRADGRFDTLTEFVLASFGAFALQQRRGERVKYPLEFVSDQSSEKNKAMPTL